MLFEDGPLSERFLSTFIARRETCRPQGIGMEVIGPRSSDPTRRMLDFAGATDPLAWRTKPLHREPAAEAGITGFGPRRVASRAPSRWPRDPGPSTGEALRVLGVGRELAPREEVDLLVVDAGPAGLGAAVYGASEGLDTLVVEGTALVARPAPHGGSRTTSAFRPGSAAPS